MDKETFDSCVADMTAQELKVLYAFRQVHLLDLLKDVEQLQEELGRLADLIKERDNEK